MATPPRTTSASSGRAFPSRRRLRLGSSYVTEALGGTHDCRHTFTSLAIAAGRQRKALSLTGGTPGVPITLDRYGHLMPGNEAEAAGLLDCYLAAADAR